MLVAACAEAPAGTFFEGIDGAIETPPLDPDAGMPNVGEPGEPGMGGTTGGGIPPFPTPMQDAAVPPVMMMDASRPPQATDAGRDTGTPPPVMMDAARPPVVQDAAPDVVAPPPDTGTPPPPANACAATPAFATPDACTKCICMRCSAQVATCYGGTLTAQCKPVRDCAISSRCTSTNCYCGDSLLCLAPNGPCLQQIETAAGTNDILQIQTISEDPSTALGASNAVGICSMANCATECGL